MISFFTKESEPQKRRSLLQMSHQKGDLRLIPNLPTPQPLFKPNYRSEIENGIAVLVAINKAKEMSQWNSYLERKLNNGD